MKWIHDLWKALTHNNGVESLNAANRTWRQLYQAQERRTAAALARLDVIEKHYHHIETQLAQCVAECAGCHDERERLEREIEMLKLRLTVLEH